MSEFEARSARKAQLIQKLGAKEDELELLDILIEEKVEEMDREGFFDNSGGTDE